MKASDPVGHLFQPGRAESGRGRRGPLSLPQGVVAQAQYSPQLPECGLAAGEACGDGRQAGGALQPGFQLGRGAAEGAMLAKGMRCRQALAGERIELAAALVEVPVSQTDGIGGLLAAVALQEPEH